MSNPLNTLSARQLRRAASLREKIDRLERELAALLTPGEDAAGKTPARAGKALARRRRGKPTRVFSAAVRAKMSAAAKARWVKARASGKKHL
jgi:hypothetical protein